MWRSSPCRRGDFLGIIRTADVYLPLLDRLLYRHPFEGGSARRYARDERPAFGDLDDRLLDGLAPRLAGARRLLDLGLRPGHVRRRRRRAVPRARP